MTPIREDRQMMHSRGGYSSLVLAGVAASLVWFGTSPGLAAKPRPVRAHADILGCSDPGISGRATLREVRSDEGIKEVRIALVVRGLPAGKHGLHIHQTAACEPCGGAGGHFDPGPNGNPSPDGNHPYHLGDLVNVDVGNRGVGRLRVNTTRVTLSPGPLSLFDNDGSALIVHVSEDTYCPDGEEAGCAGGARAACGIIDLD